MRLAALQQGLVLCWLVIAEGLNQAHICVRIFLCGRKWVSPSDQAAHAAAPVRVDARRKPQRHRAAHGAPHNHEWRAHVPAVAAQDPLELRLERTARARSEAKDVGC